MATTKTASTLSTSKPDRGGLPLVEIVALALSYYVTARIGQFFAIAPGNVTPVWIPSGIILAAVMLRGERIWPGIWLGAFAGNAWSYWDQGPWSHVLAAGSMNGVGDVLCAIVGARLVQRGSPPKNPLMATTDVVRLVVYGAVLGPGISALFGPTALWATGFVASRDYVRTLLTWWVGDGVGVLIVAPLLLSFACAERTPPHPSRREVVFFFAVFALLLPLLFVPSLRGVSLVLVAPSLLWSSLRLGQRVTQASLLILASAAVTVTQFFGGGPFQGVADSERVATLQTFLGVFAVVILVLNGALSELRRTAYEKGLLIGELETALEEIRTLQGILPICTRCKKIQDEEGVWHTVEHYVMKHSEAEFSHGICSQCAAEVYPDLV